MDRLILPLDRNLVESDGSPTGEFRKQLKKLEIRTYILGNGTPEGNVSAPIGSSYKDLDGTTGTIAYFKKLRDIGGDTSQGWILE